MKPRHLLLGALFLAMWHVLLVILIILGFVALVRMIFFPDTDNN